jgi:Uma2 family endonuclease
MPEVQPTITVTKYRCGKAQDARRVANLVIEILSPNDVHEQQRDTCRWYLAQGADAALLLAPQVEIAEYVGSGSMWEAYLGVRNLPLDDILPGMELSPAGIFAVLH